MTATPPGRRRSHEYQDLMRHRITDILLVSTPYDTYMLEEAGELSERMLGEFRNLDLHYSPGLTGVSTGTDALRIAREDNRVNLIIATPHLADMDAAARAALGERRNPRLRIERRLALCYPGQTFDMPVPLVGKGPVTARLLAATVERFHRLHEELHTYASRDQEPILRGVSLKATAVEAKPALPAPTRARKAPAKCGARSATVRRSVSVCSISIASRRSTSASVALQRTPF